MVNSNIIFAIALAAIGFEAVLTQVTKPPPDPVKRAAGRLDFHYCHCILEDNDMDAHGECLYATRDLAEACHSKKQLDKTCKREFDRLIEVCTGKGCASREDCELMAGSVDRNLQDKGITNQTYIGNGIYYAATTTLEPTTMPTTKPKRKPTKKPKTKPTTKATTKATTKPTTMATTITEAFTPGPTVDERDETPRLVKEGGKLYLLVKEPANFDPEELQGVTLKVEPVDSKDDGAFQLEFEDIREPGSGILFEPATNNQCPESLLSENLLCLPLGTRLDLDKAYKLEATSTNLRGNKDTLDQQCIIAELEIDREQSDDWLSIYKDNDAGKTYAVWPKEATANSQDNTFRLTIVQWPSVDHGSGRVIEVEGSPEKFQCPKKGLLNRPDNLCHDLAGLVPLIKHTAYLTVLDHEKSPLKTYKIDFALDVLEGNGRTPAAIASSTIQYPIPAVEPMNEAEKDYHAKIIEFGRRYCDCITAYPAHQLHRPYCYSGQPHFIKVCQRSGTLKTCFDQIEHFMGKCHMKRTCTDITCVRDAEHQEFIPPNVIPP